MNSLAQAAQLATLIACYAQDATILDTQNPEKMDKDAQLIALFRAPQLKPVIATIISQHLFTNDVVFHLRQGETRLKKLLHDYLAIINEADTVLTELQHTCTYIRNGLFF